MHLLNKEKCTIHGEGKTRRNFIHVNDVSSAIETVIQKGVVNEVYNIGSTNEYSVFDILKALCRHIRPDDQDISHLYEHISDKLHKLGWQEKSNFEIEIPRIIEHYSYHKKQYDKKLYFIKKK